VRGVIVRVLKQLRLYGIASICYRLIHCGGDIRVEIQIRRLKNSLPRYTSGKTSCSEDSDGYMGISRLAAMNDTAFRIFKRSADYRVVLEHVSKGQGRAYLDVIKTEGKDLLEFFPRFKENDRYGSPITYNYEVGKFSPTTLRYIKVVTDLKNIFGDLNNFDVVEIGAGYGGQCKIISDVYHFKSYTIVDLGAILPLIQKYLTTLEVGNVVYESQHRIGRNKEYDLLISNYAFSECVRSVQNYYVQWILDRSKRGYITYNHDGLSSANSPYNKEEIISILSKKHIIRIENERPKTGKLNFIITWDDTRNYESRTERVTGVES
jgi:putative sugar O-methyltransferase